MQANAEEPEVRKEVYKRPERNIYTIGKTDIWGFTDFGTEPELYVDRYSYFTAERKFTIKIKDDLLNGKGPDKSVEIIIGWIRPRGVIPIFYRAARWDTFHYFVYESNKCSKRLSTSCDVEDIDDKLSKLAFAWKYEDVEKKEFNYVPSSTPVDYATTLSKHKVYQIAQNDIKGSNPNALDVCRDHFQNYDFYKSTEAGLERLAPVKLKYEELVPHDKDYQPDNYGYRKMTNAGKFFINYYHKMSINTKDERGERSRFCNRVFKRNNIIGVLKGYTKDFNGDELSEELIAKISKATTAPAGGRRTRRQRQQKRKTRTRR
jgi:hypothetical protein